MWLRVRPARLRVRSVCLCAALLLCGLVFGVVAESQPAGDQAVGDQPEGGLPVGDRSPGGQLDPPEPVFLAPIYEGGIRKNRGINIPPNLASFPERRIGIGYTASNSYLNPGFLVCADRSCQLDYESDHTGNLLFAGFTQPVLRAFELGFTVGTYQMDNIPDVFLVHRLASDSALRSFHADILGEDGLPELSNAPDGRQVFTMTDLAGRRLTLEPGHRYALPLRVDLTRYFDIRRTPRVRMSLSAGTHLAVPLEGDYGAPGSRAAMTRGVDLGVSANFVHSRRLTANVSSTYHVQIARFRHDVHVVNQSSPLHGDDGMRSQYALTYGLRFAGMFGGKAPCSFAISQLSMSAWFDKARYWTWDPLVFEGGNNLRGAILGANDYGVLTFGCEYRARRIQVSLVEDIAGFSQLISDDGAGTSYDPDFAVGISATWTPGAGRGRSKQ